MSFSGDEVGGRYLDVHEHFHRFVNAKFGKQLDYLEYLTSFSDVSEISKQHRLSKPYRRVTCAQDTRLPPSISLQATSLIFTMSEHLPCSLFSGVSEPTQGIDQPLALQASAERMLYLRYL